MKKFFLLLVLLTVLGSIHAEELVQVNSDVQVPQGEQNYLIVEMNFPENHDYVSYQFTVELPTGVTLVADEYGKAAYSLPDNQPAALFNVDFPANNGIFKCYSNPSTRIAAHDGELVRIPIKANESLEIGTRLNGKLSNIVLATIDAVAVYPDDVTFNIEVVENITVLDENSATVPDAAEDVKVNVLRTINAGEWSTICLPFAMSESQVKTAFGGDVQLGNFTGYDATENDAGDIVGITVHFANVSAIEANHPYIIKVSAPVSEFMVEGVDIAPEDEPTVAAVRRTKKQWSEMIGSYVPMTIDEQMLFLSENKFWYSAGNTRMKGFRAYFDFYDVLSNVENASARIAVAFNDDAPTGVTERPLPKVSEKAPFYDLQGRRIMARPAKGLYIQNGQKRIVK